MRKFILLLVAAAVVCVWALTCSLLPVKYDILIKNGVVIDGSGKPRYTADVGINGGKVVAIGSLWALITEIDIDASGKVVCPGFIDLHTHAERNILEVPAVENYTRQGVTTVVGGNCGGSPFPVGEFIQSVEDKGIALNLILLVGHNTVRTQVMGTENRAPTEEEMLMMKGLVSQAMEEGAFGFSTGLKYIPGNYASTDEVVALTGVAASYGGFYATHMRDEGLKIIESVQEAIEIGRRTNAPIQISHHKVVGKGMWGRSEETLRLIDEAHEQGLDITFDQYPYTATSTGLTVLFPAWSLAGGPDSVKIRLDDPRTRQRIKEGIEFNILHDRGGGDPASVVVVSHRADSTLAGKDLAEITRMRGRRPTVANAAETLMELVYEGGGSGIYHCLGEDDVIRIMRHPLGTVGSDGSTVLFGEGIVHPRSYGTFPRVLGRYVREQSILTLEEAIRKMTSLPAERLGLEDRGLIHKGSRADVVVFDPTTILDNATFLNPHQYSTGIEYVIVNGQMVIGNGVYTGERPGHMLRKNQSEN